MRAEVLGPLRVTVNGTSVVPTARKARKLLAVLVLNQGRVVRVDAIEHELWGPDAPKSSATGVQNCVLQIRKRIRRALGGGDRCDPMALLSTEPTGYRLAVPAEGYDLSRYRELVAQAGEAERAGALPEASALLQDALNLWRDAPLADVPQGAVLRWHVMRLEEDRKSVLGRRLALDLRLRRYSEITGELQALTALHPYDEVLHEYLMLALYLSGRRTDALTAYREMRSAMADATGLEPSPRLRNLQHRILRAETLPEPDAFWRTQEALAS